MSKSSTKSSSNIKPIKSIKINLIRSKKGKEPKEDAINHDEFDRDMNFIGEFEEEGESKGSLCLRSSFYEERLVIKAFSGHKFLGALEEVPTMAYLIKATGKGIAYPHFKVLLPEYKYIVELRKVYGGFLKPEKYSFYIHFGEEGKDDTLHNEFFSISQKRMARGDDWYVRDAADGIIAKLDGKKISIGGSWDIEFFPTRSNLHLNKQFVATILLFTAFRRYEKDVMKRLSKNYSAYKKENTPLSVNWHEMMLYKNPRIKD